MEALLLVNVKEDTLRGIFLPSFPKSDAQKSSYGSNVPHNWVAGNSHVDVFSALNALNFSISFIGCSCLVGK